MKIMKITSTQVPRHSGGADHESEVPPHRQDQRELKVRVTPLDGDTDEPEILDAGEDSAQNQNNVIKGHGDVNQNQSLDEQHIYYQKLISSKLMSQFNMVETGDVEIKQAASTLNGTEIRQNGLEISDHYLNKESAYAIYRYRNKVYALKDDGKFVCLWEKCSSHEGKRSPLKGQEQKIGEGMCGQVYKKNENKAYKIDNAPTKKEVLQTINNRLLDAIFKVEELNIRKHFPMGLWNTKVDSQPRFIMPLIANSNTKYAASDTKVKEAFGHALYRFNKAGLYHGDLAAGIHHQSPQNVIITSAGELVAIDIDGDPTLNIPKERKTLFAFPEDQWLQFLNHSNKKLSEYYSNEMKKNSGARPLSQNLHVLFRIDAELKAEGKKGLFIPEETRKDLADLVNQN